MICMEYITEFVRAKNLSIAKLLMCILHSMEIFAELIGMLNVLVLNAKQNLRLVTEIIRKQVQNERRYTKMIAKFKDYLEHDYRRLDSYADNFVELIALSFIWVVWFLFSMVIVVALFVTCPLWIIPYSIYKSRKEDAEPLPTSYKEREDSQC